MINTDTIAIWRSLPVKSQLTDNKKHDIWQIEYAILEEWSIPSNRLFSRLNFSSIT